MKITQLSETSGAAQIQAKKTDVSFESFSASLTDEEKKAPSFFDWSDARLLILSKKAPFLGAFFIDISPQFVVYFLASHQPVPSLISWRMHDKTQLARL